MTMTELKEMYNKKSVNRVKYMYIYNCDDTYKEIKFSTNEKIIDALKKNNCSCDKSNIYQIKNKNIDINKTFSFYNIRNEDVIYVLPPPAPLPYLIYLHHENTGKVYCAEMNHADSIYHIQKFIEKRMNIKLEDQILIYEKKPLCSKKTIKEENLKRESVVLVIDKRDILDIETDEDEEEEQN